MGPINKPAYLITFEVDSLTHLLTQMVLTSLCGAPKSGAFLWRGILSRRRRHQITLVAALFVGTTTRRPFLCRFLEQKRLAALRTFFLHRLVPIDNFALRIVRAAVKNFSATRFLHHDFAATAGPRTFHAGRFLFDVLALRIIRAGDEFAETSLTAHQLCVIEGALFVDRHGRRRQLAALGDSANVPAFGITRAAIEWSEAPAF